MRRAYKPKPLSSVEQAKLSGGKWWYVCVSQLLDLNETTEEEIVENVETTDSNTFSEISNEENITDEVYLAQNKLDEL